VRTERFAIREQDGLVWIWLGDAAQAGAASIPDTRWMSDPEIVVEASHSHVRASYVRLHENVLDLTHIPYLHGGDLASLEYAAAPFEVLKDGARVGLRRVLRAQPLAQALSASSETIGSLVDRTTESWFETPAIHQSVVTIEHLGEVAGAGRTTRSYFAHVFTPETQTSTHYFNIFGTDVVMQDAALRAVILDKRLTVISEDRAALEEIERMHEDETGFQEISVRSDRAGLLMRQQILSRAAAETAAAD
jgi:vanillate O-demethylase monooxygenase subunit